MYSTSCSYRVCSQSCTPRLAIAFPSNFCQPYPVYKKIQSKLLPFSLTFHFDGLAKWWWSALAGRGTTSLSLHLPPAHPLPLARRCDQQFQLAIGFSWSAKVAQEEFSSCSTQQKAKKEARKKSEKKMSKWPQAADAARCVRCVVENWFCFSCSAEWQRRDKHLPPTYPPPHPTIS